MTEEIKQTEQVETEAEVAVEEASASLTESEIFGRLTKRNQQYMLTLDRNLAAANLTESIRQQIYQEMCLGRRPTDRADCPSIIRHAD